MSGEEVNICNRLDYLDLSYSDRISLVALLNIHLAKVSWGTQNPRRNRTRDSGKHNERNCKPELVGNRNVQFAKTFSPGKFESLPF